MQMMMRSKSARTRGNAGTPKSGIPVKDWIAFHSVAVPNDIAQIDLASGRKFTYSQMHERVGQVAGHLQSLGVSPGARVGFLALNSTDIFEVVFGTWRIGGISLALNFRLTAEELAFIVNDSTPEVIFYDTEFDAVVKELKKLTKVKHWIAGDGQGGKTDYEKALAKATPVLKKTPDQDLDDQCMLMYSSGTTGRPKGVIITHKMLYFSATGLWPQCYVDRNTVNLASMPLFHIGGFNVFSSPTLAAGGTTIIQRVFDPEQTLDVINDAALGVTHFLGVPAMYNALKLHPKNATTDFSRLKTACAGAEAVPDALVQWWYDERGIRIQEGYGMTESAASNCLLAPEDVPSMVGSAGKSAMYTEMKIVQEDGTEAPRGGLGEIWMRGPSITPGYWNRPEANAESFVDGWFKSGDIGRCDENGYFYIEDRVKDMYISGGENVYPAEVENVLYELEAIAEVAVIGVADDKWGEVGCACVVLKPGKELTFEELSKHCQGRLAKFKQPAYMVLLDALPRNATGKVLKFELRQEIPAKLGL